MAMIYAVNTASQVLAAGDAINFGSVARREGCVYSVEGGSISARRKPGPHIITTNLTILAGGAGIGTIQLYRDGVPIPGAKTSFTAANGATYSVGIADVVSRLSCCGEAVFSAALLGIAGTINNATITVRA